MLREFEGSGYAKHFIGGSRVQLTGNRAFGQSHVNYITRTFVDDIEFDWEFWAQFFDLLEKREDGIWRIFKRTAVYEKDRLDPVNPATLPDGFFESMDFSGFTRQLRFGSWRTVKNGRTPLSGIITANSGEEKALLADSLAWLNDG
jgi:hypothetical protein